jgi:hypothetical protein
LAVLAAAVIAAAAAAALLLGLSGSSRGTLVGFEGTSGYGLPLKHVGGWVSVSGPWFVKNTGDHSLVLERVVPVRPQRGIALRQVFVLDQSDEVGAQPGFRVPKGSRHLPVTVAPHTQVEIELGVQATKRGDHFWRTMHVVYQQGGGTHTLVQGLGVEVCAPASGNCPTPYDRLP